MCSYSGGCRCDKCKLKQSVRTKKYFAERRQRQPEWHRTTAKPSIPGRPNRRRVFPAVRAALAVGDAALLSQALRDSSVVTAAGCWEWSRIDKNGYPYLGAGERLHRMVIEAKHGAPLGSQQAHHICATRSCVNPDHLQPVTHRQNTAEMQQRATYVARIRELEQALGSVAPNHPALNTVPVL